MIAEALPDGLTADTASALVLSTAKKETKEQYLACAFLLLSDRNRYGKLVEDLENSFIQGTFQYPLNMTEAYTLLMHWNNIQRI
jgi:hypothetical protein